MYFRFKRLIPASIKSLLWQKYLKIKFSKRNKIGKIVVFSKDLVIGSNCNIGNNVAFGRNVRLADNVSVGKDAFLENIQIGNNSTIESKVVCTGYGTGRIKIGAQSYIGIGNILDWSDNITIGNYVHIAGSSTGLWTHSSAKQALAGLPLKDKNIEYRPTAPIIIEDNVYIGGNCTIYPGVTIGHHSVIAPNSAVVKDVEPYSMVGGVPAKFIKSTNYTQKNEIHHV